MEYNKNILLECDLKSDPISQFNSWYDEAFVNDPDFSNTMMLSTVGNDLRPSARVVLLKEVKDGGFIFYTNFKSQKGKQIIENPFVSLTFFWKDLERQIRIEGKAVVVSESESDEYFSSRPFESQIGAWVSNQSEVVNSRAELDEKFIELCGDFADQQVKRPHYWGGFKVIPDRVEFWQGRPNRLNDRILYTLNQSVECGWKIERLAP